MRKKELLAGQYNVYTVFDKVSKHYTQLYFASNDEDFIRLYLPTIVMHNALRDITLFKIGIFNDVTGDFKQTVKKRIPTDCYLFPHSRLSPVGENVSLEEIEKSVTETKNQILSDMAESENQEKGDVNE